MVHFDWRLALFAVMPAPAVSLAVIFFGRAIHARFERIQAMFSDISSRVQENLSGVRMVRAFAQEQRRTAALRGAQPAIHRAEPEAGAHPGSLRAAARSADRRHLPGGACGWAGSRCCAGRISIGSFVMFNTYMGMLVWPMIALGWVVNLMQRGSASLDRINQILRETADHRRRRRTPWRWRAVRGRDRIPRRVGGLRQRRGAGRNRPADSRRRHAWPWWGTPVPARARWCTWFRA